MTVIAFDVNETLLDLGALDAPFTAVFGDASLRPQWFALMLQMAFVGGLTGTYVDFSVAQRSALVVLAARQKVALSADGSAAAAAATAATCGVDSSPDRAADERAATADSRPAVANDSAAAPTDMPVRRAR